MDNLHDTDRETVRIIFDGEKLQDLYCGLGQYCLHLYTELRALNSSIGLFTYPTVKVADHLKDQIIPVTRWHRKIPTLLRPLFSNMFPKTELCHFTHQDTEFFDCIDAKVKILTIHDLNFMSEVDYLLCQKKMKQLQSRIDKCDAIVYISHFTKSEVHKHFTIPQNIKENVIYNGVSFATEIETKPDFVNQNEFFFTIGTVVKKKNFHVLVKIMHSFPAMSLYIAGPNGSKYAQELMLLIRSEKLDDRVHVVGTIDESQKRWLYAHCKAFLFPSLLEGFGIPVIEAMSYGKPLFLSSKTSLPEIGGDDAFYFQDFSIPHMVETIKNGLSSFSTEQHSRLIDRANNFSWASASRHYDELYSSFR